MPRSALAVLTLALVANAVAEPDPDRIEIASPAERVLLVELFTSEGCSSCPPADRWLSGLVDDPRLWERIVPVAFHVDYWDYIGWPDRFADAAYGSRQRAHRGNGYVSQVYTPGLVVGGREWRGWFRSRSLELDAPREVGRLALVVAGARVDAHYAPSLSVPDALELHVALLGFDLATDVEAGENRGRRLEHDFVALGRTVVEMRRDGDAFTARLTLSAPSVEAPRTGLAAWVSPAGDTLPIQAAGGWLDAER